MMGGVAVRAAPPPPVNEQGVQVLTRGPVHEAFAEVVAFNPTAGIVVTKSPPEAIEEVPPDSRPEGSNVTWIPGYWAWDDERNDFLWVSGVWRALPPGRQWVAGYWGRSGSGSQWTSGYWADARARETTYLPPPPATVEVGPNMAAPSSDYGWTPGSWVWYQGRYAWSPGHWEAGRSDWVWSPAHYVWTPRGYIFVDGYWDYSVERRGVLFAPVYFEPGVYARGGYRYSPSVAIDLGVFSLHLFLRPSYQHYYFGDYYDPGYSSSGFYASFSFQSGGYGYDPFYSQQRWQHRQNSGWAQQYQNSYANRRADANARPPRTWAAQQGLAMTSQAQDSSRLVATPYSQLSTRKNGSQRFQTVAPQEQQQFAQRQQDVRKSRTDRQAVESSPADAAVARPGMKAEPSVARLAPSPIVGKSSDQLGKDQAPPAPRKASTDAVLTPATDARGNRDNRKPEASKSERQNRATPTTVESQPATTSPTMREAKPTTDRAIPEDSQPARREARPERAAPATEAGQPSRREAKPQPDRPATTESVQPTRREAIPQPERAVQPSKREAAPQPERTAPETAQPSRHEAKPQPERAAPEAAQPSRREARPQPERAAPEAAQPARREARPQQPDRPAAAAPQPAKTEAKPQPDRPAADKPTETDKDAVDSPDHDKRDADGKKLPKK